LEYLRFVLRRPSTLVRYQDGVPVYRYDPAPHVPPVVVTGLDGSHGPIRHRHAHEFPVIVTDFRTAQVVHPGYVIDPASVDLTPTSVGIAFDPAAIDPALRHSLIPRSPNEPPEQVEIPPARRQAWRTTVDAIRAELEADDDDRRTALLAHLTLLLIDLKRLGVGGDSPSDPALRSVFETIEERFREPLSLRDVAGVVGLTPGYLTTLVRRQTGRTVQAWILERKLVEARRLLAETDLPIAAIARAVGIQDAAYFSRVFARDVGSPPRQWRADHRDAGGN